jgi:hypothetical protein
MMATTMTPFWLRSALKAMALQPTLMAQRHGRRAARVATV